jgi:membrane protein
MRSIYLASRLATRSAGYVERVKVHVDLDIFKQTLTAWNADKAPRLAAAIAYSTMFAIAPLLIITIAIVGAALGFTGDAHPHTTVENSLLAQVSRAAGREAAQMVRDMVDASFGKPRQSALAQVIGWITFFIGASSLFVALQDALNEIWHAPRPASHENVLVMIRDRAMSLAMLLVIGFLLMMTFLLNVAISYASSNITTFLPPAMAAPAFAVVNWVVSLLVITALFALMFKILPDVQLRWNDVGAGAFITALLFVIGQALIGLYIGKAGITSAYGAAGAVLAILIWIYYSASILLLGAEFTKIYAGRHGSKGYFPTPLQAA